jgi:hypothetical protein
MPISEYYKGSGEKVMASMKERYGEEKGKRVFYATANKKGMNRPGKKSATGPSEHFKKRHKVG